MPKALERMGEGYAKHLGAKKGTERYNKIKYGTMYAKGWEGPKPQGHSPLHTNPMSNGGEPNNPSFLR